jgi:hypothetical protein
MSDSAVPIRLTISPFPFSCHDDFRFVVEGAGAGFVDGAHLELDGGADGVRFRRALLERAAEELAGSILTTA